LSAACKAIAKAIAATGKRRHNVAGIGIDSIGRVCFLAGEIVGHGRGERGCGQRAWPEATREGLRRGGRAALLVNRRRRDDSGEMAAPISSKTAHESGKNQSGSLNLMMDLDRLSFPLLYNVVKGGRVATLQGQFIEWPQSSPHLDPKLAQLRSNPHPSHQYPPPRPGPTWYQPSRRFAWVAPHR
jgi:hypothetical protein